MSRTRKAGILLAIAIAVLAVLGAVLLVTLDFTGPEALQRLWSAIAAQGRALMLEVRLRGVTDIDLFTSVDIPGSDLKVETGTSFADARALAFGRAATRWCYVKREASGSSFTPTIELARQQSDQAPVFITAGAVTADEARPFAASADDLLTLAHQHCRFGR